MSPHDPFMDSSRSINARIITGTACKEAQLTVRTYRNLVLGASIFSNHSGKIIRATVSRFSGEGLIAYNIPLSLDKKTQLSFGAGYSQGDNYVDLYKANISYILNASQSQYYAYFWQVALNIPVDHSNTIKFFLKHNYTHFDYYYYTASKDGSRSVSERYTDTWEFRNEDVGFTQLMVVLKHDASRYFSFFAEAGLSVNTYNFYLDKYHTHRDDNTNKLIYKPSYSRQLHYVPFFARLGVEFKIKRLSLLRR